jgi:Methane oxygenase PmoA
MMQRQNGLRAVSFCLPIILSFFPLTTHAAEFPRVQAIPLPDHEVSFDHDGREIARYHFDPDLRRPFVFPVIGPSGRSLTRMGHPRDPESHSHHNSIWISHHDVNGVSFWDDRAKGRIVHRRVLRFDDGHDAASVLTENAWSVSNQVLLIERRLTRAEVLSGKEWLLTIDLELQAASREVTLGKTPFGLIGVRMAKTIGVNDGGGRILNSEGGLNEAGVFWKKARWVDYSGPITSTATEGITLMDHPSNPNHPATFHVRNDGWMGASLTFDGPLTISTNQPLKLKYACYIHGAPSTNQIWRVFKKLAAELPQ